jgi:1-acyl-sn-glycerol-3-phosphate acyltransferase
MFGRVGLWLAGVRLEITGREHLREARPRVLLQNHGSMLDFLVAAVLSPPRILVVIKRSVRWFFPSTSVCGWWGPSSWTAIGGEAV